MGAPTGIHIHIPLGMFNEGWQNLKGEVVENALFFTVSSIAMTIIGFSSIYFSPPISILTGLSLACESIVIEFAIICEYNRVNQKVREQLAYNFSLKNISEKYFKQFVSEITEDVNTDHPQLLQKLQQISAECTSMKKGVKEIGGKIINIYRSFFPSDSET